LLNDGQRETALNQSNIMQSSLNAIAVAGQAAWQRTKPLIVRDVVLLSAISF
jgi:hypothetical protein